MNPMNLSEKNRAEYEALMERIKAIPNLKHEYFCHGQIHFDSYTDWEKIGNEILNFNHALVEEVERFREALRDAVMYFEMRNLGENAEILKLKLKEALKQTEVENERQASDD